MGIKIRQIALRDLPLAEGDNFIKVKSLSTGLFASANATAVATAAGQLRWISSDDETYFICGGIGDFDGNNIVIPSIYAGLPVKEIAANAFAGNQNITSVTIPNSVVTIGSGAFTTCRNLVHLTIDEAGTIQEGLSKCPTVWFHNNSPKITDFRCYYTGSDGLATYVDMKVEYVTEGEYGEEQLYSATLPEGAKSVTLSAVITDPNTKGWENGKRLFSNEIEPDRVNPYTLVMISPNLDGGDPIFGVDLLHGIWSDDSLKNDSDKCDVCDYAVQKVMEILSLTTMGLEIGEDAFQDTGIKNLHLPKRVTKIGSHAFRGCTNLSALTFEGEGWIEEIGEGAFQYCTGLANVSLPKDVKYIGSYAFASTGLTSVTIPYGIQEIGQSAFSSCNNLETANILCFSVPSVTFAPAAKLGLPRIPDGMFKSCAKLSNVTLSPTVSSIGSTAFNGCTSLASITIPESVTEIGINAFNGCTALTSVTFEDVYGWFNTEGNDVDYQMSKTSWLLVQPDFAAESLTMLYNGSATYRWFKLEQMVAPTISAENSVLTITDPTGIAEEFEIYVGDIHRATYNVETQQLTLV